MFHPGSSGLSEDPATGSATAAAAALLAELDRRSDGELKLRIGQGVDMGRPSLLLTRVRKQGGAVTSAHVGGGCVQMMEGTFRLAGEVSGGRRPNTCRRHRVLHLHAVALLDHLGDPPPVAMVVVALVAEKADARPDLHQRREFVELFPGLRRLQVLRIDPAAAFSNSPLRAASAALLRRAEPAQMQVGDAALIEAGGELVLGEARPARGRHRAHVDQQLDAGLFQLVEHRASAASAHSRW